MKRLARGLQLEAPLPRLNRTELTAVTGVDMPAMSKLIGDIFTFLYILDYTAAPDKRCCREVATCCSGRWGMEFGAVAEGVRTLLVDTVSMCLNL